MTDEPIDLSQKFPDLEPMGSTPGLFTVNGCGLTMNGHRDFDAETGTYIKTHCIALLFVPLIALRAYRVADAAEGWYFIGRQPLSGFARFWNVAVISAAFAAIGATAWTSHIQSPEYQAARKLEQAEQLAAAGKLKEAAGKYQELILDHTSERAAAVTGMQQLVEKLGDSPLDVTTAVAQAIVETEKRSGEEIGGRKLFDVAVELSSRHAAEDPRGALALLDVVAKSAPDNADAGKLRQQLLETILAADPNDAELASELAVVYERLNELEKCEQLLSPLADRLGDVEGARILGQILAGQGKFEEAHALLVPYVEKRLEKLHSAEKSLNDVLTNSEQEAISALENDASFRARYQAADEAAQIAMVQEEVIEHMRADRNVILAQEALQEAGVVVPVALELGIVMLRRAQSIGDAEARKNELEKAEKVLLAVRGQAGEGNDFRLSLGQVYYWLGRHAEGRKLFDELLESNDRSPQLLVLVADILRDIGVPSEARTLAEEAYGAEGSTEETKSRSAVLRAMMANEVDDKITWLERAASDSPQVKALLSSTKGERALQNGDDATAIQHFRDTIQAYGEMPQDATTLNNSALACFSLFAATGDRADFDRGLAMQEEAVKLSPSDSIVITNGASALYATAIHELVEDRMSFQTFKSNSDTDLFDFLYDNAAERTELAQQFQASPILNRAVSLLDQSVLLAPKRSSGYSSLAEIYTFTDDVEQLQRLLERLSAVELDLVDERKRTLEFYSGQVDEKTKRAFHSQLERSRKLVDEARAKGGIDFAVPAVGLLKSQFSQELLGQAHDSDELVKLAEEAHAAAPSKGTFWGLVNALSRRGGTELAAESAEYAKVAKRGEHSLWSLYLVAAAVANSKEVSDAAGQIDDLQRVRQLLIERSVRFPDDGSPIAWALLRHSHPEEAQRQAELIGHDEAGRLSREVDLQLHPIHLSVILSEYWSRLSENRVEDARKVLHDASSRGAPLPIDP